MLMLYVEKTYFYTNKSYFCTVAVLFAKDFHLSYLYVF